MRPNSPTRPRLSPATGEDVAACLRELDKSALLRLTGPEFADWPAELLVAFVAETLRRCFDSTRTGGLSREAYATLFLVRFRRGAANRRAVRRVRAAFITSIQTRSIIERVLTVEFVRSDPSALQRLYDDVERMMTKGEFAPTYDGVFGLVLEGVRHVLQTARRTPRDAEQPDDIPTMMNVLKGAKEAIIRQARQRVGVRKRDGWRRVRRMVTNVGESIAARRAPRQDDGTAREQAFRRLRERVKHSPNSSGKLNFVFNELAVRTGQWGEETLLPEEAIPTTGRRYAELRQYIEDLMKQIITTDLPQGE